MLGVRHIFGLVSIHNALPAGETVRRTKDIGRAVTTVAEDICAGRSWPGAVEIPIDQQYRRAEVVMPGLITGTAYLPDADAVAKVAERLGARVATTIEGGGSIPRTTYARTGHQRHKPAAAFRPRWRNSSRSVSSIRPWPRARSTAASHSRT